jgi:hypothetical protein
MNTLLLNPNTWDFLIDANLNIAMASEPYSISQDVASACKTFAGEVYYDTTQGVPYFANFLGQPADIASLQIAYEAAAMTVPDVVASQCTAIWYNNRMISGNIEVINTAGQTLNAQFF